MENLIERYIAAVVQQLPEKEREENKRLLLRSGRRRTQRRFAGLLSCFLLPEALCAYFKNNVSNSRSPCSSEYAPGVLA